MFVVQALKLLVNSRSESLPLRAESWAATATVVVLVLVIRRTGRCEQYHLHKKSTTLVLGLAAVVLVLAMAATSR